MSGTKTTKNQLSVAKRPLPIREEPPVRWPSAATGSGAVYGVSPSPAPAGSVLPDGCAEG